VSRPELRIGIDVGATSADAVLMDHRGRLLARAKVAARPRLRDSLDAVLGALGRATGGAGAPAAAQATLSTPAVGHALRARRDLTRVAVLRLGGPLTGAVPPLATWPADLRDAVSAGTTIVRGGAESDGKVLTALDEGEIARFLQAAAGRAEAVAITGVFAPLAAEQERAAALLVRRELGPELPVLLSHETGALGLLERESATVLNAALTGPVARLATTFTAALAAAGSEAEPYVAQNDGSVMTLEFAVRQPLLVAAAGPLCGVRGAAFLSGVSEAITIDVGGTTTTVGVLRLGLPRESPVPAAFAGVATGTSLPESWSVAAGGQTPATQWRAKLAGLLQRVEALEGDEPAEPAVVTVAVGGAGSLVAELEEPAGDLITPVGGDVAGAIGAAIAPACAQADVVCGLAPHGLDVALREAGRLASARAIHAGADPRRVEIIAMEQFPLTYLGTPAVHVRVRAGGPCG
jgi:N-methylhydantoinase A/oxoprolinase/acetone carboxylase beta subunit